MTSVGGALLASAALALRHAKTCRTTRTTLPDGTAAYVRARLWLARWLVPAGNLLLRRTGAGVCFLGKADWRSWEPAVHRTLRVAGATADGRGRVVVPEFGGRPLAALLADDRVDDAAKRCAVLAAVRELRRAHQLRVPLPPGVTRTFSHGDATARNVIVDMVSGAAHWIDFESLHERDLSEADRRADDLRALLVSAAEAWPADEPLVDALACGYDDPHVLPRLAGRLHDARDNLYHLAQGNITRDRRARLATLIRSRCGAGNMPL